MYAILYCYSDQVDEMILKNAVKLVFRQILPVENSMKQPENFLSSFGVLNISIAFLTVLNCTMGFFGYLRYGDETMGTITLNISSSGYALYLLYNK